MPTRSKVYDLPMELRQALDQKLVQGGFQRYQQLSDWLADQGHVIARSTLHRYGQEIETDFMKRLDLLRRDAAFSRAAAAAIADEEGVNNEALLALLQGALTEVVWQVREDPDLSRNDLIKSLKTLGSVAADVSGAAIAQKRWAQTMQEKLDAAFLRLEQSQEKPASGKVRLDPETLRIVREEVYGIV